MPLTRSLTRLFTLAIMLMVAAHASAQQNRLPNIEFMDVNYQLAWHSDPTPDYTKHEYLPKDQKLPYFHNMLLLEQRSTGKTVVETVRAQVTFLKEFKKTNHMDILGLLNNPNTGESLLDFLMIAEDPNVGAIAEWNVYRYSPHTRADGKKGTTLYAYSHRVYGQENLPEFFGTIKDIRSSVINAMAKATVPPLYVSTRR